MVASASQFPRENRNRRDGAAGRPGEETRRSSRMQLSSYWRASLAIRARYLRSCYCRGIVAGRRARTRPHQRVADEHRRRVEGSARKNARREGTRTRARRVSREKGILDSCCWYTATAATCFYCEDVPRAPPIHACSFILCNNRRDPLASNRDETSRGGDFLPR